MTYSEALNEMTMGLAAARKVAQICDRRGLPMPKITVGVERTASVEVTFYSDSRRIPAATTRLGLDADFGIAEWVREGSGPITWSEGKATLDGIDVEFTVFN